MWLEIVYKPTTLFSLKVSTATNSAGKSLPVPSPYSVKMALLNAIITYDSVKTALKNFELIRDLEFRFWISNSFVINNCMIKIQKLKRNELSSKEKAEMRKNGLSDENIKAIEINKKKVDPFQPVVAFREYVFLNSDLKIAINVKSEKYSIANNQIEFLKKWFRQINYFGKRGCFFQFVSADLIENLSNGYSKLLDETIGNGIMFPMDDVSKKEQIQFENMNNYDSSKAKRGKYVLIFPFSQASSNKNYSYYVSIE